VNVDLDVGNGKSSLAVARLLVSTGPSRALRSSLSVASNAVTAVSTDCIAALRDELPVTLKHANITSEDNVRQTRKRSHTVPVIYDTITRKKTKSRAKSARRFEHLKNDTETFTGNPQDYMWLIKTRHRDDEDMLVYEVTSVFVRLNTGDIVGDREPVMKDGSLFTKDDYEPIHVRNFVILTNRYKNERDYQLQCNYVSQRWAEETTATPSDSEGRVESVPKNLAWIYDKLCQQYDQFNHLAEYCLMTESRNADIKTPS